MTTKWIERYRERAEQRYQRLDAVLAEMNGDVPINDRETPGEQGAAS